MSGEEETKQIENEFWQKEKENKLNDISNSD